MATDPLDCVRAQVGLRLSEIRQAATSLSPLDLYARMDAIRQLAAEHGLAALESLSRYSSQLALLPGHRMAMQSCLERPRTRSTAARRARLHRDPRRARRPPSLGHR